MCSAFSHHRCCIIVHMAYLYLPILLQSFANSSRANCASSSAWYRSIQSLTISQSYNILWGNTSAQFSKPPGETLRRWVAEIPNDGLLRFRTVANRDRLICTTPETLKSVMSDNSYDFEKPSEVRRFLVMVLGNGLIISEGSLHKFQRKHLLPAFQLKHIKELYPVFWNRSRALVEAIETAIVDRKVETKLAVCCTLHSIGCQSLTIIIGALQQ